MKIFISWSGERSKRIAREFKDWIQDVIQASEPFLSDEDIEKGDSGIQRIDEALSEYSFGVVLVTQESMLRPWIHYEAGALSKGVGKSRVCPLLLGLDGAAIAGTPLSKFQYTTWGDKEDFFKLIKTINTAADKAGIDEPRLRRIFDRNFGAFEEAIDSVLQEDAQVGPYSADPSDAKIENIVKMLSEISNEQKSQRDVFVKSINEAFSMNRMRERELIELIALNRLTSDENVVMKNNALRDFVGDKNLRKFIRSGNVDSDRRFIKRNIDDEPTEND